MRPKVEEKGPDHNEKAKNSKGQKRKSKRNVIKVGYSAHLTPPPLPISLYWKKRKRDASVIFEVVQKDKVNIPLLDMVNQVPIYAKFLKELCIVKKGLNLERKAFITKQVSVIIENKNTIKYKDSGCLTILVTIGEAQIEKVLLDLGSSVNLLPYSIFKQFELGELIKTNKTLFLADRS